MSEVLAQQPTTPVVHQPSHPATPTSTVSQVVPVVIATPQVPVTPQAPPKTEDIMKRMSEQKVVETPAAITPEAQVSLDDIKDPIVRQQLEEKRLNLEKHYNKKYMELADKIKQTESERQALNTWTPDRVKQILNDQNFVQSSQQILQEQAAIQAPQNFPGSQEEWSALSESERQRFGALENKVNNLLSQQENLLRLQDDERIRQRIPDYNPLEVDQFQQDIQRGRVSQAEIRELIWKAKNFDKSVERSYQFGLEDRNGNLQEKRVASSPTIGSVQSNMAEEVPVRQQNENSQSWFSRVAKARLDSARRNAVRK